MFQTLSTISIKLMQLTGVFMIIAGIVGWGSAAASPFLKLISIASCHKASPRISRVFILNLPNKAVMFCGNSSVRSCEAYWCMSVLSFKHNTTCLFGVSQMSVSRLHMCIRYWRTNSQSVDQFQRFCRNVISEIWMCRKQRKRQKNYDWISEQYKIYKHMHVDDQIQHVLCCLSRDINNIIEFGLDRRHGCAVCWLHEQATSTRI